jgi:hypothetical protein
MAPPTPVTSSRSRRRAALAGGGVLVVVIAVIGLAIAADGPDRREPATDPAGTFTFGLWGDLPYARSGDDPKVPALIEDMNAAPLAFSVFDGDIKDGISRCTDDRYTAAVERFNRLAAPVVYVPGDNEWTDCHRTSDGGYSNLERLDHLRRVMFARPESFGARTMSLEHQGRPGEAYSENVRWSRGDAVFVTLNVPGSNNNKVNSEADCTTDSARTPADCAADNAEHLARGTANIDWLRQGVAEARNTEARAIMIIMHANPGFDLPDTAANERTAAGVDGYTALLDVIVAEARAFPGQVALVHGSTHYFRVDKPLVNLANMVPNLTRLETFGSPNLDWVKVTADPRSRSYFVFEPMVVAANHR